MNAQAELSKVAGAVTGPINAAIKLGEKFSEGGKDKQMAEKARANLKQKVEATKENREIASKLKAKLDVKTEDLIGGSK